MKKLSVLFFGAFALFSLANAAKLWDGAYHAFNGKYLIYSGDLGEAAAPTPTDRKAAFVLYGEAAKNLYESIGPDLKDACGTSSGMRVRQKGDLDCTYDKDDKASPYVCHLGIDLQTGKSTYGSIC
jgi:hypothetical protein